MSILLNDKTNNREVLLAGTSPVDPILNPTSKNAVQNKAVYNALAEKVEKTVNDLINYYVKSDVYNKSEVRELIGAVNTLTIEVVNSLPASDISTTTIYFLKQSGTNAYDEYVYVNNAWVKIGDTNIDLTQYETVAAFNTAIANYYTQAQVDALLNSYYTKAEVNIELTGKQDILTFDNTPTAGSNNPVKSSGIKSALDEKLYTAKIEQLSQLPNNDLAQLDDGCYFVYSGIIQNPNAINMPPIIGGALIVVKSLTSGSNLFKIFSCTPYAIEYPMYMGRVHMNLTPTVIDWAPTMPMTSNENLLDNPWFTVNQRGQSSYTALSTINTYTVDRWRLEVVGDSHHSVTVNNDGSLTITNTHSTDLLYFSQPALKKEFLVDEGTEYVASVDVINYSGTIYVDVGLMDMSPWSKFASGTITSIGINIFKGAVPSNWGGTVRSFRPICFILAAGASMTIRKVKFERGTISTLANDVPPNYQQELAKCQRYFYRMGKTVTSNNGYELSSSNPYLENAIWFVIRTPVPLRAKPVISMTGTFVVTSTNSSSAEVPSVDGFGVIGEDELYGNTTDISINITNSLPSGALPTGKTYMLRTKAMVANPAYIDLSADL